MLTFLSLFFSITYLSLVNPLEKLGDSLVQKTQFTFEFLEANDRITWGQKKMEARIFAKHTTIF